MAFKKNSTLYEAPPPVFVQCCFSGCTNNANVRMFTKTGWANVCARVDRKDTTTVYHYDKLERELNVTRNRLMDEFREAYRKSQHYRRANAGESKPIEKAMPLGIALDELEQEFADRMEP